MVEATYNPKRVPTINLSTAEISAMEAQEEAGILPKGYVDNYFDAVDANVFGHDAPKDRKGNRLEQGLGSPVNQTSQSVDAYKRWCGPGRPMEDQNYAENLKKMESQLAASNEKREAQNPNGRRRRRGRA